MVDVLAVPGPAPARLRRMADLVEPLDRALRSTRVLVRQTAVAAYRHHAGPESYSLLALDLADADRPGGRRARGRPDARRRPGRRCSRSARRPGLVERADELTAEVVLAQLRSVVVDLLLLTGMTRSRPPTRCRRRRDERPDAAAPVDRALGAARRPGPVHRGGRGAAPARAGRAAGGRRRRRRPDQARGGVDGVVRGAGVRRRLGHAAADRGPQVSRTRCSCRSTTRRTTPPRPR